MDPDHWYCAYCTFANESSRTTCDICANPKQVLPNWDISAINAQIIEVELILDGRERYIMKFFTII